MGCFQVNRLYDADDRANKGQTGELLKRRAHGSLSNAMNDSLSLEISFAVRRHSLLKTESDKLRPPIRRKTSLDSKREPIPAFLVKCPMQCN